MNWNWMLLGSTLSQTEICRKLATRGSISISITLSLIIVTPRPERVYGTGNRRGTHEH